MGLPATKMYSIPRVCEAALALITVHSDVEDESIPFEATEIEARARSLAVCGPAAACLNGRTAAAR